MTGDQTSLDVSRRLAKVWPAKEEHGCWWVRPGPSDQWRITRIAAYEFPAEYGGGVEYVPAWTLADLEAETKRMDVGVELRLTDVASARIYDLANGDWIGVADAEHVIDAWGNALAEAKGKP